MLVSLHFTVHVHTRRQGFIGFVQNPLEHQGGVLQPKYRLNYVWSLSLSTPFPLSNHGSEPGVSQNILWIVVHVEIVKSKFYNILSKHLQYKQGDVSNATQYKLVTDRKLVRMDELHDNKSKLSILMTKPNVKQF